MMLCTVQPFRPHSVREVKEVDREQSAIGYRTKASISLWNGECQCLVLGDVVEFMVRSIVKERIRH